MDARAKSSTVELAASGDEVAFARLIAEHHEPMVRAAYVVVGDTELAREAAQNAWVIAWRRLSSLRQPERVRSWLVAISANEARGLVRRAKRREVAVPRAAWRSRAARAAGRGPSHARA